MMGIDVEPNPCEFLDYCKEVCKPCDYEWDICTEKKVNPFEFKINNTDKDMTNIEKRIEKIKAKKAGLSFTTDINSILKEKYSEIWDCNLETDLVQEMIFEEMRKDNTVLIYFNCNNDVVQLTRTYELREVCCDKKWKDEEVVDFKFYVYTSDYSYSNRIDLDELFVVTDFDAYIDYQLEQQNNKNDEKIERFEKKIERIKEVKEENVTYAADAQRFNKELNLKRNLTVDDIYTIDRLREAEKKQKGEFSIAEEVGLEIIKV